MKIFIILDMKKNKTGGGQPPNLGTNEWFEYRYNGVSVSIVSVLKI